MDESPSKSGHDSGSPWGELPSARTDHSDRSNGLTGLLAVPFFALILIGVVVLVWGSRREAPKPTSPAVVQSIGAGPETESCRRVTELLRSLPETEEGVKSVRTQIDAEIKHIPTDAAWREKNPAERNRLASALADLRTARKKLPLQVSRFIKTERVISSTMPTGETSIREMERVVRGYEVSSGPGYTLLGTVDAYIDACEQALGEERKAMFGGSSYR